MEWPITDLHASIIHSKTSCVIENMGGAQTTSSEWAGLLAKQQAVVNSANTVFDSPLIEDCGTRRVKEDVAYW